MELPAGDAGSWTLMSCEIFYEFGNGEMDCQLGVDLGHPCSFILALSRWVQPCNLMQLTLWQSILSFFICATATHDSCIIPFN